MLIRLRNNTYRLIDNNSILNVTGLGVNRKWLMPLKVVVPSPFTSMTNTAPLPANPAADPLETSHLISRVRETIRLKHYSLRTERSYCDWILRYLRFHGLRHPSQMGADQVTSFLSSLASERHVAAATQNQALAALLFLYRDVLKVEIEWMEGITRAKRPRRLPVVLTRVEVTAMLSHMTGVHALMARLMYGTGLRLMECLRLRVKDVELYRHQLIVRQGKGGKDRITMFPTSLVADMTRHLVSVRRIYDKDRAAGAAGVELPDAYAVKNPGAARAWGWHWVFPQGHLSVDPRTSIVRRHHLYDETFQPARPMTRYSLRHHASSPSMWMRISSAA